MAKKPIKKAKRRVSKSPVLGAPYDKKSFVSDCPKCSKVYTTDDINGGRCTGCGTAITDVYARAWSTIKNGEKDRQLAALKCFVTDLYDYLYLDDQLEDEDDEDSPKSVVYNSDKETEGADFIDYVCGALEKLIPRPKDGATKRPEFKKP